jgi:hypothetical protein
MTGVSELSTCDGTVKRRVLGNVRFPQIMKNDLRRCIVIKGHDEEAKHGDPPRTGRGSRSVFRAMEFFVTRNGRLSAVPVSRASLN